MTEMSHPISWLMLEQYHLGELPDVQTDAIARHLAACEACRACMDRIEVGRILEPLPDAAPVSFGEQFRRPLRVAAAAAVVLLGVALYALVTAHTETPSEGEAMATKGGEATLTVVRERRGSVVENPGNYKDGDRFSLRLTTSSTAIEWDSVVISDEDVYFPMKKAIRPRFQNQFPLPGAFRVTGTSRLTICAYPSTGEDDRAEIRALGRAGVPENAICRVMHP